MTASTPTTRIYAVKVLQRRPTVVHGLIAGRYGGEVAATLTSTSASMPETPYEPKWMWEVYGTLDHPVDAENGFTDDSERSGGPCGWLEAGRECQRLLNRASRVGAEPMNERR